MELTLNRKKSSKEWTMGSLLINGVFECDTLEDEKREVKVMHETRIPSGRYEILLRTFGGHHERYKVKFPFHKGMLWLQNVPKFKDILIHIGNNDDHTSGCILVGKKSTDGLLVNSTITYERMYKKVITAFIKGDEVWITVNDEI